VLKQQAESKIYTKTVDVFWSPNVTVEGMKEKMRLFGSVDVWDGRNRPDSHISKDTNLPYTPEEIKTHKDACKSRIADLRKIIRNKDTPADVLRESQYESKKECDALSRLQILPDRMKSWRPLREIDASLNLNHHKKDSYKEIAEKYPDDVFVQQIWSCIRQRCS